MSGYTKSFDATTLGSIKEKFPNLTSLNLSNIDLSNRQALHIAELKNLVELNLSYCLNIHDGTMTKIFKNCRNIESLNLTFCAIVSGECFEHASNTLIDLKIDQCDNVTKLL